MSGQLRLFIWPAPTSSQGGQPSDQVSVKAVSSIVEARVVPSIGDVKIPFLGGDIFWLQISTDLRQ